MNGMAGGYTVGNNFMPNHSSSYYHSGTNRGLTTANAVGGLGYPTPYTGSVNGTGILNPQLGNVGVNATPGVAGSYGYGMHGNGAMYGN